MANNEGLCVCGHAKIWHFDFMAEDYKPAEIGCSPDDGTKCGCTGYTPAEPADSLHVWKWDEWQGGYVCEKCRLNKPFKDKVPFCKPAEPADALEDAARALSRERQGIHSNEATVDLMASFARQKTQLERQKIATELEEILSDAKTPTMAFANIYQYIEKLKGK